MNAEALTAGILAGIEEGASDVLATAGENREFFAETVGFVAREAALLASATTDAEREIRRTNLVHLKAQVEIRTATIGVHLEREGRELLVRVVRTAFSAVLAAL